MTSRPTVAITGIILALAAIAIAPSAHATQCAPEAPDVQTLVCATASVSNCGPGCVGATGTSYSLLGGAGALSGTTDNGATLEDACRILRGSTTCVTQDSDLSGGLDYGYCAAIIVWTFGTVGTIFEEDSC